MNKTFIFKYRTTNTRIADVVDTKLTTYCTTYDSVLGYTIECIKFLGLNFDFSRLSTPDLRWLECCVNFNNTQTFYKTLLDPKDVVYYGEPNFPNGCYGVDAIIKEVVFTPHNYMNSKCQSIQKIVFIDKKCECGAEATYGRDTNLHTDWCEKYVK